MDEFEDEIDGTLITIDARYVKSIEEEVGALKGQLQQMMRENQRLQASLYAESAKSQALAKAVMILDSN
jgi:regulator of replication initiation timing